MVALYLSQSTKEARTPGTVAVALAGISWVHRLAQLPEPAHNFLCSSVVNSARRSLPTNKGRKDVLEQWQVLKILQFHASDSLMDLRLSALITTMFLGFLRVSEALSLTMADISFDNHTVTLQLLQSKTDQFRNGQQVPITQSENQCCAFRALRRYVKSGQLCAQPLTAPLFQSIIHSKGQWRLSGSPMSYNSVRQSLRTALTNIGLNPDRFGTHSLRAGGATAAAIAGVPDELIQLQGRWRTQSSMTRYVQRPQDKRLAVSQALGLG